VKQVVTVLVMTVAVRVFVEGCKKLSRFVDNANKLFLSENV
jgi:hypothetical protein